MKVASLLLGFVCLQCIFTKRTSATLWRKYISDTEAVCNDNSRATFYIGPRSRNKWIVFFESGGFCASFEECNKRYLDENSTVLMTSTLMPDKVTGRDLLSASKIENPTFYDYTHVLVPYCSSDLWLGLKTNPNKPFHFVNDSSADNFSFRGHTIFRSVLVDLLQRHNLSKAEDIVLSGSSAGGIGVLNHADWVLKNVIRSRGLNAKLKCIIDSGWFINFQDSLEGKIRPEFLTLANISNAACKDMSHGYPCCPSALCMIARGYYPAGIPLLLISSMYDIFMFGDVLRRVEEEGKSLVDNSADYLSLVSMYGGAMNQSLTLTDTRDSNVSVFLAACFHHIYLSTSSLWDDGGVLPPSVEIARGTGMFSHKIQSGNWESAMIQTGSNSSSIKDFITTWIQSRGSSMRLIDSCLGARCNPTCPDQFLFKDTGAAWGQRVQIIILVLCLAITVVSTGLKASFILYHGYSERKQKQYLKKGERSEFIDKELPPCRPHERISIACLSLSYSVDVTKQRTKNRDKGTCTVPLNEKTKHEKPAENNCSRPNKRDKRVHPKITENFCGILNEGLSSGRRCFDKKKCEEFSALAADNFGFNPTAEKGLVTTLRNGLVTSLNHLESNSQLEAESGDYSDNKKHRGTSCLSTDHFGFNPTLEKGLVTTPHNGLVNSPTHLENDSQSEAESGDCSNNEKFAEISSFTADNFGFDPTAAEGFSNSLRNGELCSSAPLENHPHLETKSGDGLSRIAPGEHSGEEARNYLVKHKGKSQEVDYGKRAKSPRTKEILKNVSVYFNPGELVAIMGPSGCGKTTLLDLLTGRRKQGHSKGHVYINGVGLGRVQDWYARKIGYVLQLAVPYYEELTVRQNLFFAAHMRLPKRMSLSRKFKRVEQILAETGLTCLADAVVGGSLGGGLSGGQKRRLCVALQMINLPSVLFLDEPTSGLDASSSLELLNHLNLVAESGRLVILTIHQPRLEIFHLFHKILLLCDGQVAYYGEPTMAPAVFINAYVQSTSKEFRRSVDATKIDAKNPADTIMDLLNGPRTRRDTILNYYQTSGEPQAVQEAIRTSQIQACHRNTKPRSKKRNEDDAGVFNRIFVLEARTSERQTLGQILYYPLIFFSFGVIVGTVYWQAEGKHGSLLMSAYGVYCCASPLFLSSVLMAHFNKALDIFQLERADGCGRSHENVIQTYVRTASVCVLPVIVCSVMSYFMVMTSYDVWKFMMVTIISLVLNQTWIAVYMMVICAQPRIAHRICPMLSAIGGFAGGFLVPRPAMPAGYSLFFYINPLFYGYSAITKVLLQNVRLKCEYESTLNCISTDGNAVLAKFGFDTINIYENLAIMLGMTVLSLILSWVFLEMKYINISYFSRKSSTFSNGDGVLATSIAEELHKTPPTDIHTARRKSTLRIITDNGGLHTVKIPERAEEAVEHESEPKISRKRSSRKERWQSTRKRTEERRTSMETEINIVGKTVRRSIEGAEQQRKNEEPNGIRGPTDMRMRTVSFEHAREFDCDAEAADAGMKEHEEQTNNIKETRF